MDELRFVRREDRSLIVANEAGEEFSLVVDDAVLSEIRHVGRREREASRVRPREIQALIRAGKTRAEVAKLTGLDEADIERYEEPVIAERNYVLERAHAVPVRTDATDDSEQRFGAVIAERLISLGADTSEWSSWRDPETGWMVALEFISRDVAHRAVWSFEHRKGLLSPVNPDAVNLSKQGDVGDRLIPKLRAVDAAEPANRFESGAFDESQHPAGQGAAQSGEPSAEAEVVAEAEAGGSPEPAPLADANAEYERRREIDQRAIKTESAGSDLSQTADLLDALRKRRGERDRRRGSLDERPAEAPAQSAPTPVKTERAPAPRSIWGAAGVSSGAERGAPPAPSAPSTAAPAAPAPESRGGRKTDPAEGERGRKGRASIPSWDDILFGTRSDEDPA